MSHKKLLFILVFLIISIFHVSCSHNSVSVKQENNSNSATATPVPSLTPNHEPTVIPTYIVTSGPVDRNKLIYDFMNEIDYLAIMDNYQVDYGIKFEYVYDEITLKDFQNECQSNNIRLEKILEKINATPVPSELKDFKSELIDLLILKNSLLDEQFKAIEKGGKWDVFYMHGMDVNINMALDHYGNKQDLLKKIQDYNLKAEEFIKNYEMDNQKYEIGDEKIIFFIF